MGVGLATPIGLPCPVATQLPGIQRSVFAMQLPCLVASLLSPPVVLSTIQQPPQETEIGICHTAPMPGGQTPFQDVEAGVCHTPSMPDSHLIIPSHGLGDMSVGVSHKAPMPGNQTHVPCVGFGVCLSAPMPGGHPLRRSGLGHVDLSESVPGSLSLFQKASVEAS
ncbi:hypothetical protein E2C01_042796 [Portunus trituberculatus]|uniref:Uncharacterized protein n=1 Tax=Portunus trituberculatus TaxID=210409 RepID=A0A5B7FVR7_PORTR|nr:hypothetical protein [Portunus trituberculatus]